MFRCRGRPSRRRTSEGTQMEMRLSGHGNRKDDLPRMNGAERRNDDQASREEGYDGWGSRDEGLHRSVSGRVSGALILLCTLQSGNSCVSFAGVWDGLSARSAVPRRNPKPRAGAGAIGKKSPNRERLGLRCWRRTVDRRNGSSVGHFGPGQTGADSREITATAARCRAGSCSSGSSSGRSFPSRCPGLPVP